MVFQIRLLPGINSDVIFVNVPHKFNLNYKSNDCKENGYIITYLFKLKFGIFGKKLRLISIKVDVFKY